MKYKIVKGDCFDLIKKMPDNSVDLVITSPPYSDIVNYGKAVSTKKPDDYCDWIIPLFKEIHRVLKPSGSFILNINDKCEGGYRSTYIYDLISRNNKETPLKLYDTYIWHKPNSIPNGSTKRFRNTTEFIFHFCKDAKQMKFYMDRVLQEPKEKYLERLKYDTSGSDQGTVVDGVRTKDRTKTQRYTIGPSSPSKEGFAKSEKIRVHPDSVRPSNVVRFLTSAASRDNLIKHPAAFHKELPLYYIKILTDEGDVVLDPFSGIATTGIACKELNRNYVGFELNETYADFSIKRMENDIQSNDTCIINQYDLEGNFIQSHTSNKTIIDAIKHDIPSINGEKINQYIVKGMRSNVVGGFVWKVEKNEI
jgi:DNA modification methylase